MTWTDARIALISRLWSEGVSASGIAEALGDVSRNAVLGKLHRMGLLRSRLPASEPRRYEGPSNPGAPAAMRPAAARPRPHAASAPPTPPRSPWRETAFAPLAGTTPRPWLTREFGECAFPVGGEGEDVLSCCAPARGPGAYCAAHHAFFFKPVAPGSRAAEQRRWQEAAERWAA